MAVAFRQQAGANSATSTLTISVPTGTQDNDIMVAVIERSAASDTPSTPSGWTQLDTGASGPSVATYWRLAASEPANYAWTVSGTGSFSGAIASYSGGATVTPINQHGALNRVTSSTSATALTITPSVDNCMIVYLSGGNATNPYTGPAGWNQRAVPGGASSSVCIADLLQTSAAATGSISGTMSASGNSYSGLIAIAPAGAAAVVPTMALLGVGT